MSTALMHPDTMTVAERIAECRRIETALRQRRPDINNRIQAIARSRARLLDDEQRRVEELRQEDAEIVRQIALVKKHRIALEDTLDQSYERTYMLAAKELLDEATHARIHARAEEIVAARRTRAAALGVGSAVPMLGAVPGMRVRE